MNPGFKTTIVTVIAIALSSPAYAQVCKEKGSSGGDKVNLDCDMTYRNTIVTCDPVNPIVDKDRKTVQVIGTNPSCPKKPMPMIDTPKKSYIADYSPYLFTFPRDAKDPSRPYAGVYAVGTPGDTSRTFQMVGNTAAGTRRLAACTTQLKFPQDSTSPTDDAKVVRMQLDNCANQYILNSGIRPLQKEATQLLSLEDPANPAKKISQEDQCQPLKMFDNEDNEYNAAPYLKIAWEKMLQDPGKRKTTGMLKGSECGLANAASGVLDFKIPCDREPHLPSGVTIENELKPPADFPEELLLSTLTTNPYEEIVDPTHPFSPRWDFLVNDRDYSKLSANSAVNAMTSVIYLVHDQYMTESEDTIFCAGVKDADKEKSDNKKKEDLEVKVDVLEFRRSAYEKALTKRTAYNLLCYKHEALFTEDDNAWWMVLLGSFCNTITGFSWSYPWIYGKDFDCWNCYGLDGKVDDENDHPPCTTNYLGKDLEMKASDKVDTVIGFFPGLLNGFSYDAQCGTDMKKVCADLRRPYTQINKLKMRYHNPDDKDDSDKKNVVLKEGALEGMSFREYFGNHMPYPRLWDTGTPLRETPSSDRNDQGPLDVTGQYTTIVGVGREAISKAAAEGMQEENGVKPEDKYTDQRCKTMGWNGVGAGLLSQGAGQNVNLPVSVGGATIYPPDPVTSWTEMKLYQARTLRNVGISCLGRYEKVFKPGSAENMILMTTGADWNKLIVTKCSRGNAGTTKDDCTYMTMNQFADAGKPKSDDTTVYLQQLENAGWPNSWRGYMASGNMLDLNAKTRFPNFPDENTTTNIKTGLDNAKLGDVILMPYGPKNSVAQPGLAKLALVVETNLPKKNPKANETTCDKRQDCYVKVLEPDNGKWPDICGTTDTWGEMKTRYYYKPGHLQPKARVEYSRINSTIDCEETRILQCEQSAWGSMRLYRIKDDNRKGCEEGSRAVECEKKGK